MRWSVRPADPGDAARIEAFLLTVPEFKGMVSAGEERQIWSWLFSAGSLVHGSYLAEDQAGAVVGHYGNAPGPSGRMTEKSQPDCSASSASTNATAGPRSSCACRRRSFACASMAEGLSSRLGW